MTRLAALPIVVVEDDTDVLSSIGALLAVHYPHEIVLFEDGRTAFDFLRCSEAAVVVLDLAMPDISGLDILRFLRTEKPHLPAVVISGERELDTAIECMKLGAIDYLTKPVHLNRLIASIARALKLQGETEENQPLPDKNDDMRTLFAQIPEGVPDGLCRAACYMQQHLSHTTYLETIAQKACLSKYHFSREFKKYFGISPIQFMLRLRIKQACSMLMSHEPTISRVASKLGFSDQSEFTKWFKKATGLTPSKFRKTLGSQLARKE